MVLKGLERSSWDGARVENDLRDSDESCMTADGAILERMARVLPTIFEVSHPTKGRDRAEREEGRAEA